MEWYWLVIIIPVVICLTIAGCALWYAWSMKDFMG